jgi:serine phosphatase RsbU (regulator of sigma subunit)/anti-sigma regulatory factor (Ser/Thr protein kinase)
MRVVVTTSTVALLAVAVLALGALSEAHTRRELTRELETRLVLEARNLAHTAAGALLSDLPELTLHPLIREIQSQRPELAFVVILDHRGRVQGHVDARQLGAPFRMPEGLRLAAAPIRLGEGERMLAGPRLLVVESPVAHIAGARLGTALVGLRRDHLDRAVASARRQQAIVVFVLLGIGVAVASLLMSRLLRPMAALRAGLERIGRGELDAPIPVRGRTELALLAGNVNDMAARLKVAQEEMLEKERLSRELEIAREIQNRLLPSAPLAAGEVTLRGWQRPAAEVGGDYFEFLTLADGRVGFAVADVSGKGLGGCLVMSMLSALLRGLHAMHDSPSALLAALERQLQGTLRPGEFITMFYGLLEPASGRLVWASAGHLPPMLWRARTGRIEGMVSRGLPLGALRGGAMARSLSDRTVALEPGDQLVLFTDGIHEAIDTRTGEMFGFERMARVIEAHATGGGEAVIRALSEAVARWCGDAAPYDDETLLIVGRRGAIVPLPLPETERDAGDRDPLRLLRTAQERGAGITLAADLDALTALGPWLARLPEAAALAGDDRLRLESALYEALANMIEHGCAHDARQQIHAWWLPDVAERGEGPRGIAGGVFVLRDRGRPFHPGPWQPANFADPAVRRRGRGLGLDILHRTMCEVSYAPGTEAGNITLLAFDPDRAREDGKEQRHAGSV